MDELKKEIFEVQKLGKRIGYGNMMQIASSLWRKDLKDKGYPTIGAFVPVISKKLGGDEKRYDEYIAKTFIVGEEKKLSRDQISEALQNILSFESGELFDSVLNSLHAGKSVLIDALAYMGNGKHENRKKKKRYRFKMIVPIVSNNGSLYSTDLYEGGSENAMKGRYAIYRATRQMAVELIAEIETDYRIERFEHGYREDSYGFYKVIGI